MSDNEKNVEIEDDIQESSDNSSALEISYLTSAILEYYGTTSPQEEDGEEWKRNTVYENKYNSGVPTELDKEIKKAFMFQIKKFQK